MSRAGSATFTASRLRCASGKVLYARRRTRTGLLNGRASRLLLLLHGSVLDICQDPS